MSGIDKRAKFNLETNDLHGTPDELLLGSEYSWSTDLLKSFTF